MIDGNNPDEVPKLLLRQFENAQRQRLGQVVTELDALEDPSPDYDVTASLRETYETALGFLKLQYALFENYNQLLANLPQNHSSDWDPLIHGMKDSVNIIQNLRLTQEPTIFDAKRYVDSLGDNLLEILTQRVLMGTARLRLGLEKIVIFARDLNQIGYTTHWIEKDNYEAQKSRLQEAWEKYFKDRNTIIRESPITPRILSPGDVYPNHFILIPLFKTEPDLGIVYSLRYQGEPDPGGEVYLEYGDQPLTGGLTGNDREMSAPQNWYGLLLPNALHREVDLREYLKKREPK